MITAKDISKIIEQHDPRIDTFIEKELIPQFIKEGRRICIDTEIISQYFHYEISNKRFQDQLRKRGFFIEEKCDETPIGDCWVEIQVLPQEE